MGKITGSTNVQNLPTTPEQIRYTSDILDQIAGALNGGLQLTENFDVAFVTAKFPKADFQIAINHGLKRTPIGYIVTGLDVAMSVYSGSTVNTANVIYFRSSAAGTANLMIF